MVRQVWYRRYIYGTVCTGGTACDFHTGRHIQDACGKVYAVDHPAVIPWTALFLYLGLLLGDQWEHIDEKAGPYVQEILLGHWPS